MASQVRGFGVWDGGLAQGGTLLAGSKGPAPSLLFLWVTDSQANLLQMELTAIQTYTAASGITSHYILSVLGADTSLSLNPELLMFELKLQLTVLCISALSLQLLSVV